MEHPRKKVAALVDASAMQDRKIGLALRQAKRDVAPVSHALSMDCGSVKPAEFETLGGLPGVRAPAGWTSDLGSKSEEKGERPRKPSPVSPRPLIAAQFLSAIYFDSPSFLRLRRTLKVRYR